MTQSLSWQWLSNTISIMANFVMTLIGNNICLHPSFQNNASLWDEATLSWFLYKIKRRFVHNKNLARPKYCQTLFVSQWLLYLLLYTCTCKIFQTHPSPLDVRTRCVFFLSQWLYMYIWSILGVVMSTGWGLCGNGKQSSQEFRTCLRTIKCPIISL